MDFLATRQDFLNFFERTFAREHDEVAAEFAGEVDAGRAGDRHLRRRMNRKIRRQPADQAADADVLDLLLDKDSRPQAGDRTAQEDVVPGGFAVRGTLTVPLATLAGLADRPGQMSGGRSTLKPKPKGARPMLWAGLAMLAAGVLWSAFKSGADANPANWREMLESLEGPSPGTLQRRTWWRWPQSAANPSLGRVPCSTGKEQGVFSILGALRLRLPSKSLWNRHVTGAIP